MALKTGSQTVPSQLRSCFEKLLFPPGSLNPAHPKEKLMAFSHLTVISAVLMPFLLAVGVAVG